MTWNVVVDTRIKKKLRKIPADYAERILSVFEHEFTADPYGGDIDKIAGEQDMWRRRVGNYRIFYEINQSKHTVYVFAVERRTSSTY